MTKRRRQNSKQEDPNNILWDRLIQLAMALCAIVTVLYLVYDHHCNQDKEVVPKEGKNELDSNYTSINHPHQKESGNQIPVYQQPDEQVAKHSTAMKTIKQPIGGTVYTVRLLSGAEFEATSSVLLDGKSAKISSHTQNIIEINVPKLGQTYEIAMVLADDTLVCNPIMVERNNQRIAITCRSNK